jgi:hypothetical protein
MCFLSTPNNSPNNYIMFSYKVEFILFIREDYCLVGCHFMQPDRKLPVLRNQLFIF